MALMVVAVCAVVVLPVRAVTTVEAVWNREHVCLSVPGNRVALMVVDRYAGNVLRVHFAVLTVPVS